MAQFNIDAINYPFGGLNIVLVGDFSQLNPIGKNLIYDQNLNVLWSEINRVVILNMKNHRFSQDPNWGKILERMHHGNSTPADIEIINTRVVGENLSLPSFEELQGNDITYACATNAERNVVSDNIFANILKNRHPKENESFDIPKQAIIIKGNFKSLKTGQQKSSTYHKMVSNKCGDDNVQCGNGQSIIRVDPCLKLYVGCPIMVSTNDHKKNKVVKGTTGKFKGIKLKENKSVKEEIWNGFKVFTVEAADVDYIVCEHSKANDNEVPRIFHLPTRSFEVSIKFPIGGNKFFKLSKCIINQFPINNDLATTGHKLQGKTKKNLVVSELNYGTTNWIYVVLSRVTTLSGLFLLQPLRKNYNPKPPKLLQNEWKFQRNMEKETLLLLQKYGNYLEIVDTTLQVDQQQDNQDFLPTIRNTRKKRTREVRNSSVNQSTEILVNCDLWLSQNNMERIPHLTPQYGNCLFESISYFSNIWKGKPVELRFSSIKWAQLQVSQGTDWGITMWSKFDTTKANQDSYGKHSYMHYLEYMMDPNVYGTEYDLLMLCEFLQVSINVYSSTLTPIKYGKEELVTMNLWHQNEHYEPIEFFV
jgi:hypothetical protein